ncbi:MAG: hypothetical protein MUO78_10680 [candidate division Zixibacteria bacterium]|nr:hypothetical protein [candidate division Zixibacteria bacterium]
MFSKYKLIFILLIIIILAVVMFFALHHSVMSEDKFIEIYIQLSIAQEKSRDNPEKLVAERKKIYSDNKFSRIEMDRFLKSYKKNPEKWVKLWERINQRLSELIEGKRNPQSKVKAF